jgi:phosphoribosylformylglycinamidine cyclo-ligase
VIDPGSWEAPLLFRELQAIGDVEPAEMRKVFNMGIGMVAVVPPSAAHRALDTLRTAGHRAVVIGEVADGSGQVRFAG